MSAVCHDGVKLNCWQARSNSELFRELKHLTEQTQTMYVESHAVWHPDIPHGHTPSVFSPSRTISPPFLRDV